MVLPIHTAVPPVTGAGDALTVTTAVTGVPLKVYVTIVVPTVKPDTVPVPLTLATAGVPDAHVPPAGVPVNPVLPPSQTDNPPVIVWEVAEKATKRRTRIEYKRNFISR
jgi:hypothetical protein